MTYPMANTCSAVAVVALMLTSLVDISSNVVQEGHMKAPVIFPSGGQ